MLIFLDTETTGLNKKEDQIIELAAVDHERTDQRWWRFRPTVPIKKDAEKAHGISLASLEDEVPFGDLADVVRRHFSSTKVVSGYNIRFDLDMIEAEYTRLGQESPLKDAVALDVKAMWSFLEPRNLGNAHLRFVGESFENAHSALADTEAVRRVFLAMMEKHFAGKSVEEVSDLVDSGKKSRFGGTRELQWREGFLYLTFGKHADTKLVDVPSSYRSWMMRSDSRFPEHVKAAIQESLTRTPDDFHTWAKSVTSK